MPKHSVSAPGVEAIFDENITAWLISIRDNLQVLKGDIEAAVRITGDRSLNEIRKVGTERLPAGENATAYYNIWEVSDGFYRGDMYIVRVFPNNPDMAKAVEYGTRPHPISRGGGKKGLPIDPVLETHGELPETTTRGQPIDRQRMIPWGTGYKSGFFFPGKTVQHPGARAFWIINGVIPRAARLLREEVEERVLRFKERVGRK